LLIPFKGRGNSRTWGGAVNLWKRGNQACSLAQRAEHGFNVEGEGVREKKIQRHWVQERTGYVSGSPLATKVAQSKNVVREQNRREKPLFPSKRVKQRSAA